MARLEGTDRGLHVLASGIAGSSAVYSAFRIYMIQQPKGLRIIASVLWLPLISIVFFYGLHETIFNPLYFGSAWLMGQREQVVSLLSNPSNVVAGLLDVQILMCFFGLVYLRRYLRLEYLSWVPFLLLISLWLISGFGVTVPNPALTNPANGNNLLNNIFEGLFTSAFSLGFCRSFK